MWNSFRLFHTAFFIRMPLCLCHRVDVTVQMRPCECHRIAVTVRMSPYSHHCLHTALYRHQAADSWAARSFMFSTTLVPPSRRGSHRTEPPKSLVTKVLMIWVPRPDPLLRAKPPEDSEL